MFRPFFAFIGCRYTHVKRKNHFISFISLASMLGLALGVTVLITVLSVMNGFHKEIRGEILKGTPHMTLHSTEGYLSPAAWEFLKPWLKQYSEVLGAVPFILEQGMLSSANSDRLQGVMVKGIDPEQINAVYSLEDYMRQGRLEDLRPGEYGVIIGKALAHHLQVNVGDKIQLLTTDTTVTPAGLSPRVKRFTVVGISEISPIQDNSYIFIHIKDANKLFHLQGNVTGVQLKLNNEMDVLRVSKVLYEDLHQLPEGQNFWIKNWTQEFADFFKVLSTEKIVMMFILSLIIAVAGFNLVSSLVMMVTDKRKDIAILRTIGASPKAIMGIFVVQGAVIGVLGTLMGVVAGLILAFNVTAWVDAIQNYFNVQFVAKELYFIKSSLPSEVHAMDVIGVTVFTLIMCLVATLYPAWRAALIQPAEALRYE